jgi:DNA-binding CsgD family transcriptional regulator
MALAALHIDHARRIDAAPREDRGSRQGALARVIEAAYDGESDDAAWLEGVVRALAPLVGRGSGVSAWKWSLSADGLSIRTPTYLGCAEHLHEAYTEAAGLLPNQELMLELWRGPSRSWSESLGVAENRRIAEAAMQPRAGVEDVLGLYASRSAHDGVVIATPSEHVLRVAPRTRAMLATIADHLGAAQRFRFRAANATQAPEAVLDSRGRVLHLEPAVERRRDTLARTIADFQATASLGSESPARAAALWSSLVAGEWSVVHHTDSDGKRLILARRNSPARRDAASLTPGERSVAELFARGHSPKAIGYELGLSPAVISSRLQVAAQKLGLRSYHELVAIAAGAARHP